jgi:hypothetical protein
MTTTLYTLTCFGSDNFETLVSNCISYSNKLLKKPLQIEANTTAAHLWHSNFRKNGQKVMDQLRKSIKMSEACIATKPENLSLLVQILNTMLYYYLLEADFVGSDDITNLMQFI